MIGLLAPTWALRWVLRHLPAGAIARLDAWSYRLAQRRAEQRRRKLATATR